MDNAQITDDEPAPRPLPPAQREAWGTFLRSMISIGLNTFGGPVAQIGVMHREAVDKRKWLSDGQFVHLLNFANILPGPEALEIAIHLGYLRRGRIGGVVAGLFFVAPGFISLTALAWVYQRYGDLGVVGVVMSGVRPVAMALVAAAAVRISRRSLRGRVSYILMAAAFLASYLAQVPFLVVLVLSALAGLFLRKFRREQSKSSGLQGWLFATMVVVLVGGGHLWRQSQSGPAAAVSVHRQQELVHAADGSPDRLLEIASLNTRAALLTFGGAYTVLPYLREQAVGRYGWLSDGQMIDALALGETTPGPLISIGVFISYLAGGFAGAIVGCVFLFLPSFLLVLGLGRYIDQVERLPHARAVLWGCSAGTLGLIVALASTLVGPSLPDLFSVALALLAFLAVWRFDLNAVLIVVFGAGVAYARSLIAGTP